MTSRLRLVACLLLIACGGSRAPGDAARVLVQMLVPADVTRVVLEVQPAGIVQDAGSYDPVSGSFTGTLVVPVGPQTVTAKAYAGATLVGSASASVTVVSGTTAAVNLIVIDSRAPTPPSDRSPVIT